MVSEFEKYLGFAMEGTGLLEAVTPSRLEDYFMYLRETTLTASAISEKMCQLAAGGTILISIVTDHDDDDDEASTTKV